MKTVEIYPGRIVQAYQEKDLNRLRNAGAAAEMIWRREWLAQGGKDEGTCTLGKALEVYYLRPRARRPSSLSIASGDFVQGNVAAYKSAKPALEYLRAQGLMVEYNDGVMD
jgi:hypothetical protein